MPIPDGRPPIETRRRTCGVDEQASSDLGIARDQPTGVPACKLLDIMEYYLMISALRAHPTAAADRRSPVKIRDCDILEEGDYCHFGEVAS